MSNIATMKSNAQKIGETLMSPAFRKQLSQAMACNEADPKIDRFARVTMMAIQSDPKLLDADRNSLYLACQSAANDRLMPDGKHGKLVVYRAKDGNNWIDKVQWQRMIGGLRVLAGRAGYDLIAEVVYANDTFKHRKGSSPGIDHEPASLGVAAGEIIGFYAIATSFDSGRKYFEVMTKEQVDKVAQTSKSKDREGNLVGPWRDWYDEQGRKTVAKRLFKSLPLFDSEEVDNWIKNDNSEYADIQEATGTEKGPQDITTPSAGRPSALQAVVDSEPESAQATEAEAETVTFTEVKDDIF